MFILLLHLCCIHISSGNDNSVFKGLADCICIERNVDVASCVEQVGNEALSHRIVGRVLICVVRWEKCKVPYLVWEAKYPERFSFQRDPLFDWHIHQSHPLLPT